MGWMSTDQTTVPAPAKRNHQQQQQQQQQQHERLECPRCGSTNTKFCYYNNYNKTQPRHLCKACKRHWTKGGTLRNVPVGGGRKNKRVKLCNTSAVNTSNNNNCNSNNNIISAANIPKGGSSFNGGLHALGGCHSDTLFQALIHPPSSLQNGSVNSLLGKAFMVSNDGGFSSSGSSMLLMPSHQDQSIKFSFSNTNDHQYKNASMESTITTTTTTTTSVPTTSSISSQPWQQDPLTSSTMDDFPSFWSWNSTMDSSVSADLDIPWSIDTEIEF